MWEIVQTSGYIDIWRFQTADDITDSFALMNKKVPPKWIGKDSTYSTGCTKEMRITQDVQKKNTEMQLMGLHWTNSCGAMSMARAPCMISVWPAYRQSFFIRIFYPGRLKSPSRSSAESLPAISLPVKRLCARSRFSLCKLRICSSMEPLTTRRYTVTGRVWPIR
jgi:hypothetical protein